MVENRSIVKMLCYFVVFLDFFFGFVKLSEPKFIVSRIDFLGWFFNLFVFIFFKHSLKFKIKKKKIVLHKKPLLSIIIDLESPLSYKLIVLGQKYQAPLF